MRRGGAGISAAGPARTSRGRAAARKPRSAKRICRGAIALFLLVPPLTARAQDAVIAVPANDPEMAAATAKARAGLPVFFGHATSPGPDEGGFMVKYGLAAARPEFVWAEVIAHKGDLTTARMLNAPRASGFSKGQLVEIRDKQVTDWAYWRAGTLIGGATMRVLIARMPAAEARAMLDRFGW